MKKSTISAPLYRGKLLSLLIALLFSVGIANALELPIGTPFTPETYTEYSFTPSSNGILRLDIEGGDDLYTAFIPAILTKNGDDVEIYRSNVAPGEFAPATWIEWQVEAKSIYIMNFQVNRFGEEVGKWTFTFTEGEITDPDPDPDPTPSGTEIQTNILYEVTPDSPLIGTFTVPENGILHIKFTEAGDDIAAEIWNDLLFTDPSWNTPFKCTNKEPGIQHYEGLTAGTIYYVNTSIDPLPYPYELEFYMNNDGNSTDIQPDLIEIELNTPYKVTESYFYGKYTPSAKGIFEVNYKTEDGTYIGEITNNMLYKDEDCQEEVEVEWTQSQTQNYKVEGNETYYVKFPYNLINTPFDLTFSFKKENIIVNIGSFKDALWDKDGITYEEIVSYDSDEDLDINFKFTPNFVYTPNPGEWSDLVNMEEWLWNQKEAIKESGLNVDGYYVDPIVKLDITHDSNYSYISPKVLFGCSGRYSVEITSGNPFVEFEGLKIQTFQVLPSIKNQYDYNLDGNAYANDGITINGLQVEDIGAGNLEIKYPKEDGYLEEDFLKNSVIIIPGLYLADIYYRVDSQNAPRTARAADGYIKAEGNKLDLSDMTETNPVSLSLYIEKNGVNTSNANTADYSITLTPSDNVKTGINNVIGENEAEIEYYNLQGVRVMNPQKGIYIVKRGNKATKMVLK